MKNKTAEEKAKFPEIKKGTDKKAMLMSKDKPKGKKKGKKKFDFMAMIGKKKK